MKKLNQFLPLTILAFLFILPFLTGCAETEREMMFPDRELPESVTISIEDVSEGATLNLAISTDYKERRDNFGNKVIIHNNEEKYTVTENFSKTLPLIVPDERSLSVKLKCTAFESENDEGTDSLRLIIQFHGNGNFDNGNYNQVHPIELGTSINLQSAFSLYDGTSKSWEYLPPD